MKWISKKIPWNKIELTIFFIFWKNGILLQFDTYFNDQVNSATFYTNWKINKNSINNRSDYTSSGHFLEYEEALENYIWVGNWDARDRLVKTVIDLENHGTIFSPWLENPVRWLLNYKEYNRVHGTKKDFEDFQERAKRLTLERASQFPTHVKECIGKFKE